MYSSSKHPDTHRNPSARTNNTPSSNASYAFLSSPPKQKHRPQPISTRCSPPRSLPRSVSYRRRSSISGSPAFQASFSALAPTSTSDSPQTPYLTSHSYTAPFVTFPRRKSVSHVQEAQIHLARRVPISPNRSHTSGSPKQSHHWSPSSTSTRPGAKSTTRILLLTPPPLRTFKSSKIYSLTNLCGRSPSSPSPLYTAHTASTMTTAAMTGPKVTSKRAKRSATPARGSAAFSKYRPMPFIQQMQMIQVMEGGTLDSHIRRHHVHAGQGTAHTGFATGGKEDIAHGYSFTDERGMIWFDEEEEWEFTPLLRRARPQRRRGFKRLLGKRRDEESSDEWQDFVEEEERDHDFDPEDLLVRSDDDDIRARDEDLASFGGALEGPWAKDHSDSSVLKFPRPESDPKIKRSRRIMSSIPTPLPEPAPAATGCPREHVVALKEEFLTTSFTPSPAPSPPSPAPSRAISPFRTASLTLFRRHHHHHHDAANLTAHAGGQSFSHLSSSLRGGEVLDATETSCVPPSPTVQWASVEDQPLLHDSALEPSTEMHQRTSSLLKPETRLKSMALPPAAARRLGIEPSIEVSLQPFADTTKKQTFRSLRRFKSTKGDLYPPTSPRPRNEI